MANATEREVVAPETETSGDQDAELSAHRLDDPSLPGATALPDLSDESLEPPAACGCDAARELASSDMLGEQTLARVLEQLSRSWSSTLRWQAASWLAIESHTTKLSISLSKLRAYEKRCDTRHEPATCGGGRYLEGTLTLRSADGLLLVTSPVRVDYGPPGAIRLELDRAQVPFSKADPQRLQRVVLSIFPAARAAPGSISVWGVANAQAEPAWSQLATWE